MKRALGPWSVVAFGITNQIGAGLFFVSTQIQQTAPGVGDLVPLLMIVGGLLTFLTVAAYRRFFAAGLVGAGGEYLIIARAIHPFAGFLATFLAWFGITGSLGTLAYAAPAFLASALAAAGASGASAFLSSHLGTFIAGLALLWIVWFVHVRGVRIAAGVAIFSMFAVVAVALTVIVYGFATPPAALVAALASHVHVAPARIAAAAPAQYVSWTAAFGTALPVLFFAYLGLSTATQTGDEAVDAPRTLGRSVLIAVCIVSVIYVVFALAVYHAVPWRLIGGLAAMKMTAATTSTGLLGLVMPPWLAFCVNAGVAFVMVKTFVPLFLAQSRWIYAWSRDGLLPQQFARTHARYQTPVPALTISAVLASFSLFESLGLGYVFGVNLRVLSVMGVFILLGVALWRTRKTVARGIGAAIVAFALWFAISIIVTTRTQPFYLQPIVQAVIVAMVGITIYRFRSRFAIPAQAAAAPAP